MTYADVQRYIKELEALAGGFDPIAMSKAAGIPDPLTLGREFAERFGPELAGAAMLGLAVGLHAPNGEDQATPTEDQGEF